jgi:hypothetical protein
MHGHIVNFFDQSTVKMAAALKITDLASGAKLASWNESKILVEDHWFENNCLLQTQRPNEHNHNSPIWAVASRATHRSTHQQPSPHRSQKTF